MSLFVCEKCGCVENTAVCGYNWRKKDDPKLCSECDPCFGEWHNCFTKQSAIGFYLGNDGFLYHRATVGSDQLDWRIENQGFKILFLITKDNINKVYELYQKEKENEN